MPLIDESHDSLPYIDALPTTAERDRITSHITSLLPPDHTRTLHPAVPNLPPSNLSPLVEAEISRVSQNKPRPVGTGVDTSRYEASSDIEPTPALLRQAYVTSTYLHTRTQNLSLLEEFGKNAWLVGNAQLEDILKNLEKELAERRAEVDAVNKARKAGQESIRGEMEGLDEVWKRGIRGVLEVEVASEGLRADILQRRRGGA